MWRNSSSVTFSLTNQMCLANLASLLLLEVSYWPLASCPVTVRETELPVRSEAKPC